MLRILLISALFIFFASVNLFVDWKLKDLEHPKRKEILVAVLRPKLHTPNPQADFGNLITMVTKKIERKSQSKVLSYSTRRVKIAIVGDSMTEFLGSAEKLKWTLKEYYPNYDFEIINMGVGSTNIDYAFYRVTNSYEYKGQKFPSIIDLRPDIAIIESFAYNQYDTDPGIVDRYKRKLTDIVHIIEWNAGSKVIIMATLAPDSANYAKGVLDLTPEARAKIVEEKKTYLRVAIEVGKSLGVPVIDAFSASLGDGPPAGGGRDDLIEDQTNIHPSSAGVQFLEDFVARELAKSGVLN